MYYQNSGYHSPASSQMNSMNIPLNSGAIATMPLIKKKKYNGPFGYNKTGTICLYVILVILVLIGAAGVGVSVSFYLLNYPTSDNSTWKIVGFSVGGFLLIIAVISIIVFACSHASHDGSKRNRVGISVTNVSENPPIGGIYNDLEPDNFVTPYAHSAIPSIQRKSSRINSRRKNRVSASYDNDYFNDYNPRKSAIHIPRIYSSYDPYQNQHDMPYYRPQNEMPYYGPQNEMPYYGPKNEMPYYGSKNEMPYYGPQFGPNYLNQQQNPFPMQNPPMMDSNKPLERPATTIIKEIHHHHYGTPDNNEVKKGSARSLSVRNSLRSQALPINNSADDVQTYQLNQSGQLNLMNQNSMYIPAQSPDEQIITINRQADLYAPQSRRPQSSVNNGASWVALYNQQNN